MVAAPALPDLSTLDADALRSLLLDHHQQLLSNNNEIEHLKLVIAKLRRMLFGTKSERVEREIEQLELKLPPQRRRPVAGDPGSKRWRRSAPSGR
jgi:hypothetical protein